jgi:hypothetical protein
MTCGPVPVRTWEASSPKVTSEGVQPVLDRPVAAEVVGEPGGAGLGALGVVCSMAAANSWTRRPPRRAPRSVLPSTATARRRWPGWSRSASHAPITPASASGSRRAKVRRMVASQAPPSGPGRRGGRQAPRGPAGGIRGPLGDRGHGPCAGQHRGSGQPGCDQRVTAATLGAWIGDGRQVDQQVTGSATCSGTASASWVRADGIGDDSSAGTSVHGGHEGVVAA